MQLKKAIAKAGHDGKGSPYLVVVEPKHQEEFSVVVEKGTYQIRDNRDDPLPRISPPVSVKEPGAAKKMVQRLEHLVQYRNAWELTNDVDSSNLGDKLAISVVRKASRAAGKIALHPGENIDIVIHNRSKRPLSAAPVLFRAGLERHADLARRGDRLPGAGRHRRRGVLGLERDGGAPRGRFQLDRAAQALRHRQADELRCAVARLPRRHPERDPLDRRQCPRGDARRPGRRTGHARAGRPPRQLGRLGHGRAGAGDLVRMSVPVSRQGSARLLPSGKGRSASLEAASGTS